MSKFNAVELLHRVQHIRAKVLASRSNSVTEVARQAHDVLLEKIDAMIVDLHAEFETERELVAHKGTPDGDEWYDIYHMCTCFEGRWIEAGPHSVTDPIHVDVSVDGEVCRVTRDYTAMRTDKLGSFGEILDQIKRDTGVEFIVAVIRG